MKGILEKFWRVWKRFAKILGTINSYLILTILYFLVIGPISSLRKIIKKFSRKLPKDSYWLPKEESRESDYKDQF